MVVLGSVLRTVTKRMAGAALESPDADRSPASGEVSGQVGLRFGLLVSAFDRDGGGAEIAPTLTRIARDAERVGFDSIWVMDHLIQIPQVGRAWDPMLESYTTLGHVAAPTERIRLGVLVAPVTFRHVAHLAKVVATLDVLSGGPVISVPDTGLYPRPIQDRVPIVVGGSGEHVTLRIAAEHADGCNLFGTAATVRRKVARLHEHCDAVGRDPSEIEVTHLGEAMVADDRVELRRRVERLRPANVGPDRFAERVNAGIVDDHEAGFRRLAAAGVDTAIVSVCDVAAAGALDPFGDLIARLR